MALEIERKFLVRGDFLGDVSSSSRIVQGYLAASPVASVRVRIYGEKGYMTVKGRPGESGMSRFEWEKEIPASEAWELMKLCPTAIIDKTRHLVDFGNHIFEVDEFHGDNAGLVVAEIELSSSAEEFEKPPFLGKEVTGDGKYYNSSLSRFPYKCW